MIGERNGSLWASDSRGGIVAITPKETGPVLGNISGLPNGLAIDRAGDFLVTDIDNGRLYRVDRSGKSEMLVDSFAGEPLGALNFVYFDRHDRIWLTVSTRKNPRSDAIRDPTPDGFILVIEDGSVRLMADGLYFANEVRIDNHYRHLYLAETAAGRVLRYPLLDDGSLGPPEAFGPDRFFDGALVDGLAFDENGALWVTEVTRNGIYAITPDQHLHRIFEDPSGERILFPSSLCFFGHDLSQVAVGSTRMDRLATFSSPISGGPMAHWR